uniref:Uncharacterized protein n=1 Tax=Phasianus colchicus TaxID=9054 RepID=A0A669PPD5_PHACC
MSSLTPRSSGLEQCRTEASHSAATNTELPPTRSCHQQGLGAAWRMEATRKGREMTRRGTPRKCGSLMEEVLLLAKRTVRVREKNTSHTIQCPGGS